MCHQLSANWSNFFVFSGRAKTIIIHSRNRRVPRKYEKNGTEATNDDDDDDDDDGSMSSSIPQCNHNIAQYEKIHPIILSTAAYGAVISLVMTF